MKSNNKRERFITTELANLFNNKETTYIEQIQRMPRGIKVWHPSEIYKNVKGVLSQYHQ